MGSEEGSRREQLGCGASASALWGRERWSSVVGDKEIEEAIVDHIVPFRGTVEKRLALVCRETDNRQCKEGG